MEIIAIDNNQWDHPDVGFLNRGTNINFPTYLDAIKKHLTEKMQFSSQQIEEAISTLGSNNIVVADYFNGKLAFGVPVE
jgi:hypothetical protein